MSRLGVLWSLLIVMCSYTALGQETLEQTGPSRNTATAEEPALFLGNSDLPPMIFQQDGQTVGLIKDIMDALSTRMATDITFETDKWRSAQDRVSAQEAKGLVQLNRNPAREEYLLFSAPLLESKFSIFRRSDRTDIVDIRSLNGMTVGVESAGYPKTILAKHPGVMPYVLQSWAEGFRLVEQGQIDALIADRWVGEFVLAQERFFDITVIEAPVEVLYSHIAVHQSHPSLLQDIDQALASLKADGTFERILSQWRGQRVIYISEAEYKQGQLIQLLTVILSVTVLLLMYLLFERYRHARLLKSRAFDLEHQVKLRTQELELARDEAEASNKVKTTFLASMSHEIRTPIISIIGYGDILSRHPDPHSIPDYGKRITGAACFLLNLVNNILDTSKMEADALELENKAVDVRQVVTEIINMQQGRADLKGLSLLLEQDVDMPEHILIDPTRLQQIVMNLIGNAIKFTQKGGVHIRVRPLPETRDKGRFFELTVQDTGIGIAEDALDRIFNEFTQANASIARQYQGTGLGLSISKKLVTLMGGSIFVQSTLGYGSVFKVILPLMPCASQNALSGVDHIVPRRSLDLLVVDDVQVNRTLLETVLTDLGHHVTLAENGADAVNLAQKNKVFDAIIMDIHLPRVNGFEAAKAIRASFGPNQRTPIVAVTAENTAGLKEPIIEAGMDNALEKPVDAKKLLKVLDEVLKEQIHLMAAE